MDVKNRYLSGSLTGIITTAFFHPIDALRIRLFYTVPNIGSLISFYNGIGFNVATACIKNVLVFPTQECIRDLLLQHGHSKYDAEVNASISCGLLLSVVSAPINVIKIPLQANHGNKIFHIAKQIYSNYGFRGFYRGGLATCMRDVLWNGLYFPLFKYTNENHIENKFAASIATGVVAMTVTYPFDGIRLYRQNNRADYNFWHGFKRSFNLSRANLHSYLICLTRVPLGTTLSHMCYLYINQWLNNRN